MRISHNQGTEYLHQALELSPHPALIVSNGAIAFMNSAFRTRFNARGFEGTRFSEICPQDLVETEEMEATIQFHGELHEVSFHIKRLDLANAATKLVFVSERSSPSVARMTWAQAQKMAELGFLISGVIHEISTPVNAMLIHLALIEDVWPALKAEMDRLGVTRSDDLKSDGIKKLEFAFSGMHVVTDHLYSIIRTVRGFSEATEEKRPVELLTVIENALVCVKYQLNDKKIRWVIENSIQAPPVFGSESQLTQIVLNLLTNAIKAVSAKELLGVERKERAIYLRVKEEGEFTLLEVEDTGCGMKKEVLDRLFEPFFTSKMDGTGTGLGLFLVREMINRMGGNIQVSSQLGKGSRFSVRLPAHSYPSAVQSKTMS